MDHFEDMVLTEQEAAQEQFDAMTCRCFSGVYRRYRAPFRRSDIVGLFLLIAVVAVFAYFEYSRRCLT